MPKENGKGLRATKWQVMGTIIVAAIPGLFASFHSMCSIQDTAKDVDVKMMVKQINETVIPAIQKVLEGLGIDHKKHQDESVIMREDIAYMKGALESQGIIRPKVEKLWGMHTILKTAKDGLDIKKKSKIPTLKMQYQQMGPSLEGAIRNEKDD
jgi:hypothetical protein